MISSYSSLNNFEEGRESKISSAKVNKIRESKIFLYDISMVKYDLSYVIYDNKYRYTTSHNILLEGGDQVRIVVTNGSVTALVAFYLIIIHFLFKTKYRY